MIPPFLVLASTTSHKLEPLAPTLEIFARLGLNDLDLNLWHVIEDRLPLERVAAALAEGGHRVRIVSGGWCDFFDGPPGADETTRSVERQVALARALGASQMRLFFGRLPFAAYTPAARATAAGNIRALADCHPDMLFAFENHDGVSLRPEVCREILEAVGRPNVRMNFDPINFERHGVSSVRALDVLRELIAHVHLKGAKNGECCEFGAGDVDLVPMVDSLIAGGYTGGFTVEYEGPFDRTLRLYEGVRRARSVVENAARRRRSASVK